MRHELLIFFFLTILSPAYAAGDKGLSAQGAHIIDHEFPGCPTNSSCSKELGKRLENWTNILKKNKTKEINRFFNSQGIPVEVWATKSGEKEPRLIIWDSPCANHNLKGKEIFLAQLFTKNLGELLNQKELSGKVLLNRLIIENRPGQLETFFIPRGNPPIEYSHGKLQFNQETDGNYFSYAIDINGKIGLNDGKHQGNLPENIECPKHMIEAFLKLPYPKELFQSQYCKNIWNADLKKYVPTLLGWSCF